MDAKESSLETIARGQLAHGVSSFLAGTSTVPWEQNLEAVKTAAAYCARQDVCGQDDSGQDRDTALCLGLYLEGHYYSMEKRGAHHPALLRPINMEEYELLLELGRGWIKAAALSPELPGAPEAIKRLRKAGVIAAAAHSAALFDEALEGINAGISLATHTFNGMRALSHHEPGILGAVLTDDRVICEAIADGIHLAPAILKLLFRLKGPDRIALISDSVSLNGLPDGKYELETRTVTLSGGAIRLEDGRLAGSCLSLDRAVRNMVRFAGAGLPLAVRMASLTPARALGIDSRKGSVAVGKDADLILFDDDIHVQEAVIGGRRCRINPRT
jgi:N-acetylglucosamine-6-phosphate deacetylase